MSYSKRTSSFNQNIKPDDPLSSVAQIEALEQRLWQEVQRAYAKSRGYRAGDNPEYAQAVAAWEWVANGPRNYLQGKVVPFKRGGQD